MNILITGNLGYIGRVLTPILMNAGHKIVGYDLGLYDKFVLDQPTYSIHQIYKDIRKVEISDLTNIDVVIHLAGLSNDPLGSLNPGLTNAINYKASVKLAALSKQAGVKRFIFSSSCSVYGRVETEGQITETTKPFPITEYSISKLNAENDIKLLADQDFCPIFLRNATVYGDSPSLRLDLVVNSLLSIAYFLHEIQIMSDGLPWRPLIHIQDLCQIFKAFLTIDAAKVCNQIFNVGFSEENYQVKGIAEIIKTIYPQYEIKIKMKNDPDSRSYNVSFAKLDQLLHPQKNWNVIHGVHELISRFNKGQITKTEIEQKHHTRLKQLELTKSTFLNPGGNI